MEARYYAPSTGRFLNRDPKGFSGGINLYNYCGGDPINYVDPSGLDFLDQSNGFWTGAGVAAVIVCTGGAAVPIVAAIAAGAVAGAMVDHFIGGKPWGESAFNGIGGAMAGAPVGAVAGTFLAWRTAGAGVITALGLTAMNLSPIEEASAPPAVQAIVRRGGYRGGGTGGGVTGGGTGGGPHLPLGRAVGSQAQVRMISRLLTSGVSPRNMIQIQIPERDMVPMMDSAGGIHFNLQDTTPEFMADSSRYTAQEWDWINQNSQLWPKVTVYNVPDGINVPFGITTGPDF